PYDGFRGGCHAINSALLPLGFVMGVAGLVQTMCNGHAEIEQKMMGLIRFIVITGTMAFWYPPGKALTLPSGTIVAKNHSIVQALYDICNGSGSLSDMVGAPSEAEISTELALLVAGEAYITAKKDAAENPGQPARAWSEYLQQ